MKIFCLLLSSAITIVTSSSAIAASTAVSLGSERDESGAAKAGAMAAFPLNKAEFQRSIHGFDRQGHDVSANPSSTFALAGITAAHSKRARVHYDFNKPFFKSSSHEARALI